MEPVANFYQRSNLLRQFPIRLLIGLCLLTAGFHSVSIAQENGSRAEEIVITATRLPRTIENIAGTISVISEEVIEYELIDDLDDIVRYQPGLSITTAARGGNLGISIRGIGGNRVLTVIDGVRSSDIYAAGPSAYGKDSFDTDNLKSIEIIRGPASVLYGADAMGGAVLLNSKDPKDYLAEKNGSYFKLRSSAADADDQYKLGLTAAFQTGAISSVAQFTHREFQEQDVNGPGRLNPQDGNSDGLLLKSVWDITDEQSLTVSFDAFTEENDTLLETDLGSSVTSSMGSDRTDRLRYGFDYRWEGKQFLFDSLQLAVNYQQTEGLQQSRQERTSYSFLNPVDPSSYGGTAAIRRTDFEFNQNTLAANLNLWKTLSTASLRHNIAYGLNFDETDTERPRNRCDEALVSGAITCQISAYPFAPTEDFPNKTFPDTRTQRFGVYLQDEIVIGNSRLTLIPGIRYDRYEMKPQVGGLQDASSIIDGYGGFVVSDVEENATSLSLGAIYDLTETVSLFAQFAEGYRPPNFDEANQAFVNLGYGYATIPNPELKAESSKGIEVGIRANLDNAFISLVAYKNRYQDFIESTFAGQQGNISLFQDRNIGEVEIYGAEISSNWYFAQQWQLRASLAYTRGDNKKQDSPLDSVDPLTAVIGMKFDSDANSWGGELLLTVVAEKDRVSAVTAVTADNYAVVDLISYYKIGESGTLRFGAFNVFNEKYARWANISGLPASNSNAIENAFQPGTNFRVGFSYEF